MQIECPGVTEENSVFASECVCVSVKSARWTSVCVCGCV